MCGFAVSSSPAVCSFSSFWLTAFVKSFTVLRYHSLAPSCLMQVSIWKTLDSTVNEYTISDIWSMMKLVEHLITGFLNHCTDQFEVFSHFLVMAEVDFWCIHAWGKQTREMDTTSSKPDRSLMWYQYFGICQLFLQYCSIGYPPMSPYICCDSSTDSTIGQWWGIIMQLIPDVVPNCKK